MTVEQVLGSERSQAPSTFHLVRLVVPGHMDVQLVLAVVCHHANVAHEPNLNPVGAFDVIVQFVIAIVGNGAIATRQPVSFVYSADVGFEILFDVELFVAQGTGVSIGVTVRGHMLLHDVLPREGHLANFTLVTNARQVHIPDVVSEVHFRVVSPLTVGTRVL